MKTRVLNITISINFINEYTLCIMCMAVCFYATIFKKEKKKI